MPEEEEEEEELAMTLSEQDSVQDHSEDYQDKMATRAAGN